MKRTDKKRENETDHNAKSLSMIKKESLALHIIAPLIVSILVVLIVIMYSNIVKQQLFEFADYVVEDIAQNVVEEVETEIKFASSSISSITKALEHRDFEQGTDELQSLLEILRQESPFDSVGFVGLDGIKIKDDGNLIDVSTKEYFTKGLAGERGVWVDYDTGDAGEAVLNFYAPVCRDEEIIGVAMGYYGGSSHYDSVMSSTMWGEEAYVLIIDENNMILSTTNDSPYKLKKAGTELLGTDISTLNHNIGNANQYDKTKKSAQAFYSSNGEGRLCIRLLEETGWYVVALIPANAFQAVARRLTSSTTSVIITLCVVLLLYIGFLLWINHYEKILIRKENQKLEAENNRYNEENQRAMEQLKEAMHKADSANQAKTSFLFSMSHDIRTPMNAIMGFTRLAQKVENNPKQTTEYLDKISLAEENLLRLLNSVLEMSRIESGAIKFAPIPTDVSGDLNKTLTIFGEMAKEKQITLTGTSDIKYPYVYEDESVDAQVAINIVGNAIKYTPAGGSIHITLNQIPVDTQGCILEFKVVDNGIGMSKEFLEHAYDNFSREKTSSETGIQGAGLGLGIVKRLVELGGGTIDIQSEQGVGTTVTVQTHHKYCQASDLPVDEKVETTGCTSLRGKRVLLVEDNALNMEIAKNILEDEEIIVETACNGKEACEKLFDCGIDYYELILMDVQMPVMDGYEATRVIRRSAIPEIANIPIIALTANAFEEDKHNALEAGMNSHLAKPIDIPTLLRTMEEVLSQKTI